MKQNTLIEWVNGLGARGIKNRIEEARAVPEDDPRRDAAREMFLREGENIALLKIIADGRRVDAAAGIAEVKARVDARILATWSEAKVRNHKERFAFFNGADMDCKVGGLAVFKIGGGATSTLANAITPDPASNPDRAAEVLADAERKPGACVGFGVATGYLALCVKVEDAEATAERLALPHTLCWESDGWRTWVFRGEAATDIDGEKTRIVSPHAPTAFGSRKLYAPMGSDTKWIVPPKSALTDGATALPQAPEKVLAAAEALSGGGDELLDGVIVG